MNELWHEYLDTNSHSADVATSINRAIRELKSAVNDGDLATKVLNAIYFMEKAIDREALWAAGKVSVTLCDDCRRKL